MIREIDYSSKSAAKRLAFYTDLQRTIDAQAVLRTILGVPDLRAPAQVTVMMRFDALLCEQIRFAQAQLTAEASRAAVDRPQP